MIPIVVTVPVKPSHSEDWPETAWDVTAATRTEPGNTFFEWSRSLDEPNEYALVEGFQDEMGAMKVS